MGTCWTAARRLTALAALVLVAAAVEGCSSKADAGDPATVLSCSGGPVTTTMVDHDSTTKETRTPREQATAWASVQAGAFTGTPRVSYESSDRTDITFTDRQGQVTAVLTYRNDGTLGWRLDSALSCA